jgi:exoribonuclease-2
MFMKIGQIVEYIDNQRIHCAVVLEVKNSRLRLLTEHNREVKLSEKRLSYYGGRRLDPALPRDSMVETLKGIGSRRKSLMRHIDIKELWEVLNTEQEWIDLPTMTVFCFSGQPSGDHESAVIRAFFENRIYFKFDRDSFFPNSQEKVERLIAQAKKQAETNRLIEEGSQWLNRLAADKHPAPDNGNPKIIEILKSFHLFGKDSPHSAIASAIIKKAKIDADTYLFDLLVKAGVWNERDNIDFERYAVSAEFPPAVIQFSQDIATLSNHFKADNRRRDLTALPLLTIDGQTTLEYDDALSIEKKKDHYLLGIHITDVGHYIRKKDLLDQEAISRGSSIYTPDQKISMLPAILAEDLCSLKEGHPRPAISMLAKFSNAIELMDVEIVASIINVKRQLTYYEANLLYHDDKEIQALYHIAYKFRQDRLARGAVQITLPEINTWLDESGTPMLSKINRESPSRLLVSEMMIMANWMMGRFLAAHQIPAIFRSQPDPKGRLYAGDGGNLFQNWMQRKLLSRFVLSFKPEKHSGLGLDVYTTATSPIRKYSDLLTQRQIRAALGLEEPYSQAEIEQTITQLAEPLSVVSRIQIRRSRFWIYKYLEDKIGSRQEAIVLMKRRNGYQVLLPEFMLECSMPIPTGIVLKPEDVIRVTIQNVNARRDTLTVFYG